MSTAIYSSEVRRRCRELTRAGAWPPGEPSVVAGTAGSLDDGAMANVQLKLDRDLSRVADAKFKVFGCSATLAAASLVTDRLVGASFADAQALDARGVAAALDLPDDKRAMAEIAVAAVRGAVAAWERRRASGGGR